MRCRIPMLIGALALVAAACGGGDDQDTSDTSDTSADSLPEPAATATTAPVAQEPVDIDLECEDVPDPANYPEGAQPPAIRPCEVPDELVVSVIREGNGRAAATGDTLIVDYTGILSADGTEFDSSYPRGVPLDFPIGRGSVIQGWDQGFAGVQPGALVKLDIPADLAYGDNPQPGGVIEPGDALTFITEVHAVIPSVTVDDGPFELDIPTSDGALELEIIDVTEGDGQVADEGKTAVLHLLLLRGDNQVILHNSWETDDPIQIIVAEGNSIPGLVEALRGMAVGGQRIVVMPPDEAFGPDGEPQLGLPAGEDLVAVIELVGVY